MPAQSVHGTLVAGHEKQGIGDGCQTKHYAYQNSQLHGNQDQDPEE
jgi:hypothetical protein